MPDCTGMKLMNGKNLEFTKYIKFRLTWLLFKNNFKIKTISQLAVNIPDLASLQSFNHVNFNLIFKSN